MHVGHDGDLRPVDDAGRLLVRAGQGVHRSRLHLVPPFRRRLVEVPFRLHHPLWVEDPDFDLDYHIRRIGAPEPRRPARAGRRRRPRSPARPLDRTRPLWELRSSGPGRRQRRRGRQDAPLRGRRRVRRRAHGQPLRPRARAAARSSRRRAARARARSRPTSSWSATPSRRGPASQLDAPPADRHHRPAGRHASCRATATRTRSSGAVPLTAPPHAVERGHHARTAA